MVFLKSSFLILVLFGFYASAQNKYICDFENGLCSFLMNKEFNKENWMIGNGKMNSIDVGPSVDHTLGNANGSYIFVNVSAAKTNEVELQTAVLTDNYCVRFFYHMYGADIGDLTAKVQSVYSPNDYANYFFRSKTQGDQWKEAMFYVNVSGSMKFNRYRVIFSVKNKKASNILGDIALDDIEMTPTTCPDNENEVEKLCSFDYSNCGYTAENRTQNLAWEWQVEGRNSTSFKPKSDHTLGTDKGGYWYVDSWNTSGMEKVSLSSPKYKAPKNSLGCLHFYYYIVADTTDMWSSIIGGTKEAYIQAYVSTADSWTLLASRAMNITVPRRWTYVEAELNISQDYEFEFVAGMETRLHAVIALDDVKLFPGNCPEAGFCDFERNKCGWTDGEGDFNWLRKEAKSTVNRVNGPFTDNTLKMGAGHYVVISTEGISPGSEANLESERFPPYDDTTCLSFYYFLNGNDVGKLKVVRREVENTTESTVWALKNDSSNRWRKATVPLRPSSVYSQIVFRGIIGNGKRGFMALDDVKIKEGEKCDIMPATADPIYEETTEVALSTMEESTETVIPQRHCEKGYKLCKDGKQCIPGLLSCDGVKDCEDGSDETYGCSKASLCGEGFYFCSDRAYPPCIHRERVCDGISDCRDGSDESLCDMCIDTFCLNDGNCSVHDHKPVCSCRPSFYHNRCNKRTATSPEPEDRSKTLNPKATEVALSTTAVTTITAIPQRHCDKGFKLCKDGQQCIPGLLVCDGVKDCEDGSDETYGCDKASLCDEGFYFCGDRAYPPCIHREKICDGFDDCSDGSDESLCNKCIGTFCQNGGNCSIIDRKLVCRCKPTFYHNRCTKTVIPPEPETRPLLLIQIVLIVGIAIADILLIAIMLFICCRRRTNV